MENEEMMEFENEDIAVPEESETDVTVYDEDEDGNAALMTLAIGAAGGLAALIGAKAIRWTIPKVKRFGGAIRNKFRKPGTPIETTGTVLDDDEDSESEKSEK